MTLKLEGNFTYTQRKPFQEMLKAVSVDGIEHIVIDLSQVAFLDSAALGAPDDFPPTGGAKSGPCRWPIPNRRYDRLSSWPTCTKRFHCSIRTSLRWPKERLSLFRWHGRSRACRLLSDVSGMPSFSTSSAS